MNLFIIGEIVHTRIAGAWRECEILDIHGNYAYVYIFSMRARITVSLDFCR